MDEEFPLLPSSQSNCPHFSAVSPSFNYVSTCPMDELGGISRAEYYKKYAAFQARGAGGGFYRGSHAIVPGDFLLEGTRGAESRKTLCQGTSLAYMAWISARFHLRLHYCLGCIFYLRTPMLPVTFVYVIWEIFSRKRYVLPRFSVLGGTRMYGNTCLVESTRSQFEKDLLLAIASVRESHVKLTI
uniref:Uncharacterized protein n=1 Tax=Bionectria ochroleuca TaxID=29856 RepID=A0A8H7TN73_BIOOC